MTKLSLLAVAAALLATPLHAATDAERGAAGAARPPVGRVAAPKRPIAYGEITQDGTTQSGTGNFSSVYNASAQRYEITINNINYYYLSYTTVVTSTTGGFCQTDSTGGKLIVHCTTLGGAPTQATFGFVTF